VGRKPFWASLVFGLTCFILNSAFAVGSVTLAWDPSPDSTVVGYRVYYGVASGNYTNSAAVGNVTNATVANLVDGVTYYFAATAYDSAGGESDFSNEATYTVPISNPNQPPTLNSIANVSIDEDAAIQTVSLSGIDDGDPAASQSLTVSATSSNPSLIPNPTVSYTSPATTGNISFTPVANAYGSATITVTVNDGQAGNNTFSRSFVVTVNPVNDAPTLNALANVTINEDAPTQTRNLTGISSGAANESQTLVVTAVSSNPGLLPNPTVNYTSPSASGSLSFTPVANQSGTATITVTVNDGQSANNIFIRSFNVTVNPVNDAPTLDALSNLSIAQNANAQTVNLTGISAGAGGEVQTLTVTATSSNPSLIPTPTVNYASPSPTGSLVFTPASGASGTATITVVVNDGQTANNTASRSFTVTVIGVNQPPTLNPITDLTINEDASAQTVSLTGIGTGSATETQTLSVTATSSNPSLIPNPSVTYASPNATGSLSFTPGANANGTTTITVVVNDGQTTNNTVSRTFTVTVNAVNDSPTLNSISSVALQENAGPQTVNLTGIGTGAANENQSLNVSATSSNPGLIPNPTVSYTSPNATGTLSFTPVTDANGSATITVTVNDGQSANNLTTRTFVVSVSSVNNPPTLNNISNLTIDEDASAQTVALTGIGTGAANETQTLTVTASSSNPSLIPNPTVNYSSPNTSGSLSLTPVANGSGSAVITVTVNDGQAISNTIARTFTVTVSAVNDAPTLGAIANVTIAENATTQTVGLTGIGTGAANEIQTLAVSATSSNPSLIPTPTVTYTSPNAVGSLSFRPAQNANGSATITVTVNDGQATNNIVTRTFTVTVTEVNSAPTITSLPNLTLVSTTNSGPVGFTVGDVESSASTLTLSAASTDTNIVPLVNIVFGGSGSNRTVTVTPKVGSVGSSDLTVSVSDGQSSASSTFRVTVIEPAPQPGQLSLTMTGSGTITPDLTKLELIVGQSYTVTATPSAGYVFGGWTGGIQSASPTITFVMTPTLALQANFVVNPFSVTSGTYNGLFYETDEVRLGSAGAFNAYVDNAGNYSAWVQIGGARQSFSGQLGANLETTNVLSRSGMNPLTVEIQVGSGANAGLIFGRVSDGVWSAPLSAGRYQGSSNAAGEYTLVIPGTLGNPNLPAGDSYATFHLGPDGLGTLSGTLADGTQFSQTAYLTENGDWPLYVSAYSGKGALVSWLNFTNLAGSDVSGDLVWIKQSGTGTAGYSAGFTNGTKAVGSKYVMPASGGKSLNLSGAVVTFTGGELVTPFNNVVSYNDGNSVVNLSPNEMTLSISKVTGTFSGTVREPANNKLYYFGGVVLQKQNTARGTTIGATSATRVVLAAP